jgi:Kef-type K+ transport system membrane component KefB
MHNSTMQLLMVTTAAIILIVCAAQVCGHIASKIGQPAVVGEMIAGVLLGPSAFGMLMPQASALLFPAETKRVLYVFAMLGLSLYMFLVGMEHEGSKDSAQSKALPILLGILGVLVPMGMAGATVAWLALDMKPADIAPDIYILYLGVGVSVTAFPMLARILQERRMVGTTFGAIAIRAAAIDDALAWIGLAIVSALAIRGSALSAIHQTVIPSMVMAGVLFIGLPKLFTKAFQRAVQAGQISDRLFGAILVTVLLTGLISDYIGIYSVFGGFITGMAMPKVPGFTKLMHDRLLQLVRCLLLPIFFTYSGLNTDVWSSFNPATLGVFLALLVVAMASKALPALALLRRYRWPWGEAVAMAGLMNARGLMILVYMNIGLSLGLVETRMFSIMVLIAIVTTAVAMPVYRLHFSNGREETARADWNRMRAGAAGS